MNEYDILVSPGNLGFYKSCDAVNVFLIDKENRIYNYYAIFVLSESDTVNTKTTYITDKLVEIDSNFRLGIYRKSFPLSEVREIIHTLKNRKGVLPVNIGFGGDALLGELSSRSKQFVPQNGSKTILLNKILKNNFVNGSYVIEFFDETKPVLGLLVEKSINKIAETVRNLIPIDLSCLRDRIGNVLFQFPSQVIHADIHSKKDGNKLITDQMECNVLIDPRINLTLHNYQLMVENKLDDIVTGFSVKNIDATKFNISGLQTDDSISMKIVDTITGLMQMSHDSELIMDFKLDFAIGHSEYRVVKGDRIELKTRERSRSGKIIDKTYKEWIQRRKYTSRLVELEEAKEFMQYSADNAHCDQRDKAIKDIRNLIKREQMKCRKIYLWDPYLSSEDIINTLFYCETTNIEMRAITALDDRMLCDSEIEKEKDTKEQHIANLRKELDNADSTGINLEFRCRYAGKGFPFHDRFIIFVYEDGFSKTWSLGKSLNCIGKGHHIIQRIEHSGQVMDSFEKLWFELSDESCLIWRSE